jgi:uracil-DNA glycosylase
VSYSIPLTMAGPDPAIHGEEKLDGRLKAAHGGRVLTLISSYHCSRYNTNTGVLTTKMFEDVVAKAKKLVGI